MRIIQFNQSRDRERRARVAMTLLQMQHTVAPLSAQHYLRAAHKAHADSINRQFLCVKCAQHIIIHAAPNQMLIARTERRAVVFCIRLKSAHLIKIIVC